MSSHRNAWIIFGIGMVLLILEWTVSGSFPEIAKQYVIDIPIGNLGQLAIVGTLGGVLTICSMLRLLDIIPVFSPMTKIN